MDKLVFHMSSAIPGDKAGIRNYLGSRLLLAGVLRGLRKGGLWNCDDLCHSSREPLKRRLIHFLLSDRLRGSFVGH